MDGATVESFWCHNSLSEIAKAATGIKRNIHQAVGLSRIVANEAVGLSWS